MKSRVPKKNDSLILLTDYFASRIDFHDKSDPLLKQVISAPEEKSGQGIVDFCGEGKFYATEFLVHRYPDRAVLLATNRCFGHCRFCFRKNLWNDPGKKIDEQGLWEAAGYLKKNSGIKELIISGGDPLTLSTRELKKIIARFAVLPQISLIRIASRALTFAPERIDAGLLKILKSSRKQIWFVSHINHGRELGRGGIAAIARLRKAGIPVLNQTVLLKGINDRSEVLIDLFRRLAGLGVKPYYLFQCDPVPGSRHFATNLKKSLALVAKLSENSGIISPRFAFELPGYGKLAWGPGWEIIQTLRGNIIVSPSRKKYFYPA